MLISFQAPDGGEGTKDGPKMDDGFEKTVDRGDRERALIAENQELIETAGELERMCAEFHQKEPVKLLAESQACSQGLPHSDAEDHRLLRVQGVFKDLLCKNRLLERDEVIQRLQREMGRVQEEYQQAKDEVAALQARERDHARRAEERDAELRDALGALEEAKETLNSERSIHREQSAEVGQLKEEVESLLMNGQSTGQNLAAELVSDGAVRDLAPPEAEAEAAAPRAWRQQLPAELAAAQSPNDDEPEIIGTRKQELQELRQLRQDVERLKEDLATSQAREQEAVSSAEGLQKELAARELSGDGRQGRAKEHQELLGRVVELQRELALAKKQAHEWKLQASQPWYERILSCNSCVSKKPGDMARAVPPPEFALAGAAPEGGGAPAGAVAGQGEP